MTSAAFQVSDQAHDSINLQIAVNGEPQSLLVQSDRRLAHVLREDLGLTGTKIGCEVGVCGACTVLVDGRPTASCLTLAAQVQGSDILTVEGLEHYEQLQRLQDAFITEGGYQCGYCTSGQLMTASAMILSGEIREMSEEDVKERMLGNLCRCTGYYGIFRAIAKAAE